MSQEQALTGVRILDLVRYSQGLSPSNWLNRGAGDQNRAARGGDMTRGLMSSNSDGMAPSFLSANLGNAVWRWISRTLTREVIQISGPGRCGG